MSIRIFGKLGSVHTIRVGIGVWCIARVDE